MGFPSLPRPLLNLSLSLSVCVFMMVYQHNPGSYPSVMQQEVINSLMMVYHILDIFTGILSKYTLEINWI